MTKKEPTIIIHENQSTIFDFTGEPKQSTIVASPQIKKQPPYHKELFPNVVLIQLSKTNYLALIAKDYSSYNIEFYYKKKDGTFNVFRYMTQLKIFKLVKDDINSKDFLNQKHFMMEDYSCLFYIDNDIKKSDIEVAFIENDFDKVFKILASL